MRILQVCPRYYPDIGGVEEHVRNIAERLTKKCDIHVYTTDPSKQLPKHEVVNGVQIRRFPSWAPSEAYFFSSALRKQLKLDSGNFDIVHTHCYSAFPSLYAAQTKAENKLVFTPHYHGVGHTFFRSMLHKPYKIFARKIFEKAEKIVSVSPIESNLIKENFKNVEGKISLVPNGVNIEEFKELRRKKRDSRVILTVGRLEKYKGVQYILQALPKLEKDVTLEVVGKGPYKNALIELAKKLSVTERVEFVQDLSRQDLLQKYADADVFVLLSKHEAYGITVAESLCAGTPCLVAKTSALVEWIDDKNCYGIDFPINLDRLSDTVKHIIGRRANTAAVTDWATIAENLLRLYEQCYVPGEGE